MMGTMIKGMGADHVVWGSDAVWTGSPQWQIEALRRLEIPDEMQKSTGSSPWDQRTARLSERSLATTMRGSTISPAATFGTRKRSFCEIKENYKKEGEGRSNRTYGYILKPTA